MTHQYGYDAATVLEFLREFDLQDDFRLNIEANHCTLAGYTFVHDLVPAASAGMLGSGQSVRENLKKSVAARRCAKVCLIVIFLVV